MKFLGEPRDVEYAMEWMSLVMVNEFTLADGGKLKCKHCHAAPPGRAEFQKKVILEELPWLPRPAVTPAASPAATPAAPPATTPPAAALPAPGSATPTPSAASTLRTVMPPHRAAPDAQ